MKWTPLFFTLTSRRDDRIEATRPAGRTSARKSRRLVVYRCVTLAALALALSGTMAMAFPRRTSVSTPANELHDRLMKMREKERQAELQKIADEKPGGCRVYWSEFKAQGVDGAAYWRVDCVMWREGQESYLLSITTKGDTGFVPCSFLATRARNLYAMFCIRK